MIVKFDLKGVQEVFDMELDPIDDVRTNDMYQVIDLLSSIVGKDDTFIDCGAHIGFVSVPVILRGKPKLAIAVEPNPGLAAYLKINLKRNIISPYVIETKPLWSKADKEVQFILCGAQSSVIDRGQSQADGKLKLKTITIDSLVQKHKITGPIVLKIDVELAEPQVLAGAFKSMKQIKAMIVEALPNVMIMNEHIDLDGYLERYRNWGFIVTDLYGNSVSKQSLLNQHKTDLLIQRKHE